MGGVIEINDDYVGEFKKKDIKDAKKKHPNIEKDYSKIFRILRRY